MKSRQDAALLFNGETTPRHTFLCIDSQCLPPGDPIILCAKQRSQITGKSLVTTPLIPKHAEIWECLPFVWKPGNFGENSNGTVHPSGNFPEKQVIHFEVLPFSRSYRNDRNLLYHLFGLPVSGFLSRESEKFTGYFVNCTAQSRSCFRCQKKYHYYLTEMFPRNFRTNGKRSGCFADWFLGDIDYLNALIGLQSQ